MSSYTLPITKIFWHGPQRVECCWQDKLSHYWKGREFTCSCGKYDLRFGETKKEKK